MDLVLFFCTFQLEKFDSVSLGPEASWVEDEREGNHGPIWLREQAEKDAAVVAEEAEFKFEWAEGNERALTVERSWAERGASQDEKNSTNRPAKERVTATGAATATTTAIGRERKNRSEGDASEFEFSSTRPWR